MPDLESIELSDTFLKLKKDGTAQLTATANPDGASIEGITFASDTPDVATVDTEGNITAIADGKATITAYIPTYVMGMTYHNLGFNSESQFKR